MQRYNMKFYKVIEGKHTTTYDNMGQATKLFCKILIAGGRPRLVKMGMK